MEVARSTERASVGPPTTGDSTGANGDESLMLDVSLIDDGRSSSLSEIDDVSDSEPFDYEPVKPEKQAPENDSEAETERVEDSPNNVRVRQDIVVSAGGLQTPSKLAQSTTYDDVEDEEEQAVDDSPSKPQRSSKTGDIVEAGKDTPTLEEEEEETSLPSEALGKKRKRVGSGDDTGTELGEEEPPKRRRGSVKSDLSEPVMAETPLSPQATEGGLPKPVEDGTPAEDVHELDLPAASMKGKKGKKGKRKGKKVRELDEETENGGTGTADDHMEEDETAERVEDVDDGEAVTKHEEESAKRMSALESLAVLEREFASLRDKIYDEKISKLNIELQMLTDPSPTHPEFLRQLECVKRHRDAKIHFENTLFQYRVKSLLNKSLAERAQAHSTYFQRIRDTREKHSSAVSRQFYAIQHDRFKTEELSPNQSIPFPTRRSQQIAHQTAYNQEVSVMAGVAKYVGFPAAPTLSGARPSELDDDLEKMGISVEPRVSASQPSALPRGAAPSTSTRNAAEEAFLEQTPWANPQHPFHQHQGQQRQQSRVLDYPHVPVPSFTTPASQKHGVDVNAPNGSASTIPENMSATNSSMADTPIGVGHEQHLHSKGQFEYFNYDADRGTGFRSLSSSPLDVRKPHPYAGSALDHRSPHGIRSDAGGRNAVYSPTAARLGAAASKRDSSPPAFSSKSVRSIHHQPTGFHTGSGSSMAAR